MAEREELADRRLAERPHGEFAAEELRKFDCQPVADQRPLAVRFELMDVNEPAERAVNHLFAEPDRRFVNVVAKSHSQANELQDGLLNERLSAWPNMAVVTQNTAARPIREQDRQVGGVFVKPKHRVPRRADRLLKTKVHSFHAFGLEDSATFP